jgi:heme/copper-type cytochrome/quinol oxidase subunit 2
LDLAIGVSINKNVAITFDETMIPGSVTYTIEPNPGGISHAWSGTDTIITISHIDFLTSTKYWVNITAGTDLAGNNLNPIPYSFSFDTAATAAIATGPIGGPTNVAGITITYNTVGAPLSADLYYTTDTSVPYTWTFFGTDAPADGSFGWTVPADGSYGWFVVSPDESAPTPTDIPEASVYLYDGTQPEVVSTTPLDMAVGIILNQAVIIIFNETMVPGSVTYTIEPNPGGLSNLWGGGDTQLTISHTDFAGGTRYWVNITAATDLAGNDLDPIPYSFYFDTITWATATGPLGGPINVAGISITYGMVGNPSSVDLYYTTDIISPYTWTLVGTDSPADGTMGWTVPADGTYGWTAVSPDETAPLTTDAPEVSAYIYDGTQPEILDTLPLDTATGVLVDQVVIITFNETMIPGSVTYTLEPNPGGLSDGWTLIDTVLTISHTDFAGGTRFWVNITAATDLAGNSLNPLPYSFYFDTQIPDSTPPTVITMIMSDPSPTKVGSVIFTLTFSEDMDTLVDPTVTFGQFSPYNTYNIIGSWNSNTSWTGSYAVVGGTGDGDYRVRVTVAEDLAGNPMTTYTSYSFEIDTTAPTSSVDTLSNYQNTLTFDVSYTRSDSGGSGIDFVELYYRRDGGAWTKYGGSHSSSPVSFTAPGEGFYEFYTIATDFAGNKESAKTIPEAYTTVDITKPDIISIALSEASPVKAGTITITVAFDEDMDTLTDLEVTFGLSSPYDANTVTQTTYSEANWTGTFTVTGATGDGTYTISITLGSDLAGNEMEEDTTFTFVIDTDLPDVSSAGPTGSDVQPTSKITIAFNESMNKTSVQEAFSFTDGTTTWTIANGTYSWSGNTLTFTPANEFEYDDLITVTISTDAKDLAGNAISSEYAWFFTIIPEPDTTAPNVSTVSHRGDDAEITNKITITFSERMNHSEVEDAISISPGITIQSFSWLGNTLTITFSEDLKADTEYTVTIGTDAEDEAGNSLEDPYTWSFTPKEEEVEPESNMTMLLLLIIIIVVVLLLLLLMMKKRKSQGALDGEQGYPEEGPYDDEYPEEDENMGEGMDGPQEEQTIDKVPSEEPPVENDVPLEEEKTE